MTTRRIGGFMLGYNGGQMDSIIERRSIRKYKEVEVPQDQIEKIVEAAVKAPSAKNRQPWKYIVYSESAKKELLDIMEDHHLKALIQTTGLRRYVTLFP